MKKLVAALAMWVLIPAMASAGESLPVGQSTPSTDPNSTTQQQPASDTPAVQTTAQTPATTSSSTVVRARPNATPEQLASLGGFHLNLNLDNSVGSGTFVDAPLYAYAGSSLNIGPTYSFVLAEKKFMASAGTGMGLEYTRPDNVTGRRFTWSDIRFGLSAPALYRNKATGIAFTPSVGYTVPITLESWTAGMIGNASVGVNASRSFFEKLNVSLGVSGVRGIFGKPYSGISAAYGGQRDAMGNAIFLCRTGDVNCVAAGNNLEWRLGVSSGVNYAFTDKLSAGVGYSLSKGFKTAATWDENDPNSCKITDSNGQRVCHAGYGQGDNQVGNIWASYSVTDVFSVNASVGNAGPPKTRDNKAFRFPFYNFTGPADGTSEFSLGVSAQL